MIQPNVKRRNGRNSFIQSQRREELVFLDADIAKARAQCAALLSPETVAVLNAAFGALEHAPISERHDFWTKAAAKATTLEPSREAKAYNVVEAARRWRKAWKAYNAGCKSPEDEARERRAYSSAELDLEGGVVKYEATLEMGE